MTVNTLQCLILLTVDSSQLIQLTSVQDNRPTASRSISVPQTLFTKVDRFTTPPWEKLSNHFSLAPPALQVLLLIAPDISICLLSSHLQGKLLFPHLCTLRSQVLFLNRQLTKSRKYKSLLMLQFLILRMSIPS